MFSSGFAGSGVFDIDASGCKLNEDQFMSGYHTQSTLN